MTTIHTRQLQEYTQDNSQQYTKKHLKIQHVQKVNNTKVRKYCTQFLVFFPTHNLMMLSPQSFTSHHFTTHINFSHKVSFSLFPALHFTSLHFASRHFTSLHFTHFYMICLSAPLYAQCLSYSTIFRVIIKRSLTAVLRTAICIQ